MFIYFSTYGANNGKPFRTVQEAFTYLYNSAEVYKLHYDAVLKDMQISETAFTLFLEAADCFKGRSIQKIGIKVASEEDAKAIKTYVKINF